eukprot:jgi/Picre1/33109/NNA_008435.t1
MSRLILCCLVVASGCMSGHALSLSGNRKLMGLFDGWTKDVSKPSYTRETTYHGIGGDKTVEKTAVYTGSTKDDKAGEKTKYTATATGSASGDGSTTSVSISSDTIDCRDEIGDAPAGIDCLKTDVSAVGSDSVAATINQDQAYQGPKGDATASADVSGSLDSDGSVLNSLDAFAITAATADENGGGLAAAGGNVTFTGDVANSQASIDSQTTIHLAPSSPKGPLDDVVSKIAPLLSRESSIVNVVFVYDPNVIVVSHTCQIPRKSINKVRLSFSLPHQVCRENISKIDAFAFPLEIQGIWVCVFTRLDTSLLYLCPEKCMKVKISIRHQKKQGSVELSSISQQFLLGRQARASAQELSTIGSPKSDTPTQPSMSTTALNEWIGMLDDNDLLFAQPMDSDLSSQMPEATTGHTPNPHQTYWKGIVSDAKALLPKSGCSIHDIRQIFDLLFAVFGSSDEYYGIQKGQLVTTKYILTMVSDDVRPYLAMDMLEALESGPDAVRIWTDVTLKCLSTYAASKSGH